MNPVIERRLDDTARQLQLARTIKFSAVLLCATTLALLVVGLAVKVSVVSSSGLAWGLVAIILTGGFLVWFVSALIIAGSPLEREELAHETERAMVERKRSASETERAGEAPAPSGRECYWRLAIMV